jgi:hypothetical protein
MDLFAASGIDLPRSGGAARRSAVPRSVRTPLLAHKVVEEAIGRSGFAPDDALLKAASDYARKVRGLRAARETTFRPVFIDDVLIKILGYSRIDPDKPYTLADEHTLGMGSVDTALGHFEVRGGVRTVVAPFELKGPDTKDLDRMMPGRGKTPVQQAWEYANDAPGAKWVLMSNCVEIRLYGYGRWREAYEVFDVSRLDEPDELRHLWEILRARNLLGGATERLLRETDAAYKDVTDRLYQDYSELRERLISFLVNSSDGPKLTLGAAIEPAQKILDRILFIAFAQRRELMRGDLLQSALKSRNEFNPQPVWNNFLGLFRRVDKGDHDMDVPPYNGGLFAHDALVDSVMLPEDLAKDIAELGNWDYRREVPVTVLGHIFEQSVTDFEKKRAEARGQPAPKVSVRKRTGVVYTPDMVTRFLVEQTVGLTLDERRAALRAEHGLSDGEMSPEKEVAYWRAWLEFLRGVTIVDPACGSGAFLIAAFDRLAQEYRPVLARLEELGAPREIDAFDEIVTKNLYGVDLNPESIEITRLSLWLKTARRDHRLQNLEKTIRVGDGLIEDGGYTARPFDWRTAFPQVFERGGFDIVIGNPPYVRMEHIKPIKPYLEKHYRVAADRADLYAYFYERGVGLLKEGSRLGFISSSTFFRTGSGEPLRRFLSERTAIETIVDFGDAQLFEGVTTYPAIVTLRKTSEGAGNLAYLVVKGEAPADLGRAFREGSRTMPRTRLAAASWRVEDEALAKLRDKIAEGRNTLGEVYGAPMRGIVTGLNEAFIIDTPTRDRLVRADPKSAELLKPFLRGENIKRWRVEPEGLWLINTPKGKVDINAYPAIRDWLLLLKPELEKRATKQEWFELQQAQLAYQPKFETPKLVYLDIAKNSPFSLERIGVFIDCTVFMIEEQAAWLVSFLNSKVAWFQWIGQTPIASGGYIRLKSQYVETTLLPGPGDEAARMLARLGQTCTDAARERFEIQSAVRRRVLDLGPPDRRKITGKLHDWHKLDFTAFRAEIKRAFRADVPLRERGEWEIYLGENAAQVRQLSDRIASSEREIDQIVYGLFDLTPAEITLLDSSIDGQF